jgi:hypothetical protein
VPVYAGLAPGQEKDINALLAVVALGKNSLNNS